MEKYTILLSRIFLSAIFFNSGIKKLLNVSGTQEYMQSNGVPGFLIFPTIIVLLVGATFVLIGYQSRWGALLLIGFLIPTTIIFHPIITDTSGFLKNLALIGGLLMVYSFGTGSLSLEQK
jgi:putative oxidoreductase